MKRKYDLNFSGPFLKQAKKLIKRNPDLAKRVNKVIAILKCDPFYQGLKTHKVESKLYGFAHSSRVTKDVRIIWNFNGEVATILDILDIGGHSGKGKVYK